MTDADAALTTGLDALGRLGQAADMHARDPGSKRAIETEGAALEDLAQAFVTLDRLARAGQLPAACLAGPAPTELRGTSGALNPALTQAVAAAAPAEVVDAIAALDTPAYEAVRAGVEALNMLDYEGGTYHTEAGTVVMRNPDGEITYPR